MKKTQILDFMKVRPIKAEISSADGRTDPHDEGNIRFPQLCERASKDIVNPGEVS